jgi:hydroxymethylbilane synthase
MPAVSQGAIAIETRLNDPEVDSLMEKINHTDTMNAVVAERAFLAHLQGGCQVPLGCYSKVENGILALNGFVASIDGIRHIRETSSGKISEGAAIGIELAEKMMKRGADQILNEIRNINNTQELK